MSLVLNVGISLRDGHYFAALLHSFLPVLLIVLCEYGQATCRQQCASSVLITTSRVIAHYPSRVVEFRPDG